MRHPVMVLGTILGMAGCDGGRVVDPTRFPYSTPPAATFTLEGTVRADGGFYLSGAKVTMVAAGFSDRETTTNDSGYFRFPDVSGAVRLIIAYQGYVFGYQNVLVSDNRTVDIIMIREDAPRADIIVGQLLHSSVSVADSPCDPGGWDARAPCRRLRLLAPRTGLLTVRVTWTGQSDLDLTIMTPQGDYLAYSTWGRLTVTSSLMVLQGVLYEVWVHSYYETASFDLIAEIQP